MGKNTGKNPTDRGKLGTKRSVLTKGRGVPLGVAVSGANPHALRLLQETLNGKPIRRPRPTHRKRQHLCLDKGYHLDDAERCLRQRHYASHIKSRGEEAQDLKTKSGYRARRWVVERTHSWSNRFRRLLTRWEKKSDNYLAMLLLSFAYNTLSIAGVLG